MIALSELFTYNEIASFICSGTIGQDLSDKLFSFISFPSFPVALKPVASAPVERVSFSFVFEVFDLLVDLFVNEVVMRMRGFGDNRVRLERFFGSGSFIIAILNDLLNYHIDKKETSSQVKKRYKEFKLSNITLDRTTKLFEGLIYDVHRLKLLRAFLRTSAGSTLFSRKTFLRVVRAVILTDDQTSKFREQEVSMSKICQFTTDDMTHVATLMHFFLPGKNYEE